MSTRLSEVSPAERAFVNAMRRLAFGRFERIKLGKGELILDPWPTTVQVVKFGTAKEDTPEIHSDFALKRQVIELFEYVRALEVGEIRILEVRHGLPFAMEVALAGAPTVDPEGIRRG